VPLRRRELRQRRQWPQRVRWLPLLQEPPPPTLTFVIALSPVFFSVTTTVMVVFGSTVVPGETLLVVRVVEGLMGP